MYIDKEDLFKNSHVYLQNYIRTADQPLNDTESILQAIQNRLQTPNQTDLADSSKFLDSHVQLSLPGQQNLIFNNIKELLETVDNLAIPELLHKYSLRNDFWQRTDFPLDLILKHLSSDYTLEKVQFSYCNDECEDIFADDQKIVSYCFSDDDDIPELTDDQDFIQYLDETPLRDYQNQILYQLREKSTDTVVSTAITAEDLPLAIFVSNQTIEKHDWFRSDPSEWIKTETDIVRLPITKTDQITTYLNKDAWINDSTNHIPLDSRQPLDMEPELLSDEYGTLWSDYHAILSQPQSNLFPDSFSSNDFYNSIIQAALDNHLQVNHYYQKLGDTWFSTLTNARKDKRFLNYQPSTNDSDFEPYFEIKDTLIGTVLDTQVAPTDLIGVLLKNIWKA